MPRLRIFFGPAVGLFAVVAMIAALIAVGQKLNRTVGCSC
jgi:hypothetical protein